MPKRFAKKSEYRESDSEKSEKSEEKNSEKEDKKVSEETLFVTDYSEKAVVVTGDTLSHSKALKELGGTFNPKLRVGAGWIFSKARKESIENYISTGEIKPYVFDKSKFENKKPVETKKIFEMLYKAFDKDQEYDGEDILEVIKQIEHKFS